MDGAISGDALVARAVAVVNARKVGDHLVGDVGSALLAGDGKVYTGVCIDAGSGIGFCAEHSAIAAMVTAGEHRISTIVAVWKDEQGETFVVSPCGRCRELIRQMHPDNLETRVILGRGHAVRLAELLPYPNSFAKYGRA
jgi:cytidine deaminase